MAREKNFTREEIYKKYNNKTARYAFRLLPDKDQELIDHINAQHNKSEYIKSLILQDMKKQKGE